MTKQEIIKELSDIIPTANQFITQRYGTKDGHYHERVVGATQSLINSLTDNIKREMSE